jgi:hypothetical protein
MGLDGLAHPVGHFVQRHAPIDRVLADHRRQEAPVEADRFTQMGAL